MPQAAHLEGKKVDSAYYKRHLIETAWRISLLRVAEAKALVDVAKVSPEAAQIWAHYEQEEMLHDDLFIQDLERVGVSREEFLATEPYLSTKLLAGFFSYLLDHEGPLGLIAYSYLVEYVNVKLEPRKLEALKASVGEKKIVGQVSHSHTDINDDHPGEVWAALRFLIKGEQDIEALKRYLAEHQKILAMYFISMSEYELLDAARLREALDIAGASVQSVTLVRNKLEMKAAVQAQQLRVPRFMSLERYLALQGQVPWTGATVLKPHSGASSMDVSIYQQPARAFDEIRHKIGSLALRIDEFQVEEYISGPIRHFDGLVLNGRVITLLSSEYVGTCLDYMERGQPLGSMHIETTASMYEWVSAALQAVQIQNGAFHLEAIMAGDEPVFLEVGNRVGGADVVATYELATGIHLPSMELRIHVDGELDLSTFSRQQSDLGFGWFVFPGHTHPERIYRGLDGAEELRASAHVVQWNELSVGALLPEHVTYSAFEAPLAGIVKSADPQQTQAWMQALFSRVRLAHNLTSVA